jgi:hypothetical protein
VAGRSRDQSNSLKGRIAEAFVEAIFQRAGYLVSRVGRESQVQRLVKIGVDEFLPDFLVRKPVILGSGRRPLHRLIPMEVKYRYDVAGYLHKYGQRLFEKIAPAWPDLCVIFVTDNPGAGRSCFQVMDIASSQIADTVDLHAVPDLDIYESTVREYESLVSGIFRLLDRRSSATRGDSPARSTAS